jgi:hypothetical protein
VVVKHGWLEKKGGSTVIMPDGSMQKGRNLKKGGRRTWTKKYFVLLDNGVLLYYKEEEQSAMTYDGNLQLGAGSEVQMLDGLDFVASTGCEADAADSSKPSLLLRADSAATRDQWQGFIEGTVARAAKLAGQAPPPAAAAAAVAAAAAGAGGGGGGAAPQAQPPPAAPPKTVAPPPPAPAPAPADEGDDFEF